MIRLGSFGRIEEKTREGKSIKTIALVSCGKSKTNHLTQARHLYTGDLFKKASEYAERTHVNWMILSALHGLVDPEKELEPYEYTLNGLDAKTIQAWAEKVFEQLKTVVSTDDEIYIYAGESYRKYLIPLLENAGYKIQIPFQRLGIGQQLSRLKKELNE